MLGIMFTSEIRGTLTINGIQMNNKAIAKRFRTPLKEINKLITELEGEQVFSRFEDRTIYSRRMYRESNKKEEISRIRSRAGKEGMRKRWKQGDNKPITELNNKTITNITAPTPTPTPSPSPKKNTGHPADDLLAKEFSEFWGSYPLHLKKQDSLKAFKALRKKIPLETIAKATNGYNDYLKHQRVDENFNQKPMHPTTFLRENRWEDYVNYEYKARL